MILFAWLFTLLSSVPCVGTLNLLSSNNLCYGTRPFYDHVRYQKISQQHCQIKNTCFTVSSNKQNLIKSLNVKDFDAKGDGITNDSIAFAKAISRLKKIGGGELFIPEGIYYKGYIIADFSNMIIRGVGIGRSVIKVASWQDGIRIAKGYPVALEILYNITISNLTIDGNKDGYGNGPNDTYGNGINLNACDNVLIKNTEVYDPAEQGIVNTFWQVNSVKSKNIVIDNNKVSGCKAGRIGIGIEGQANNALVTNNNLVNGGYIFMGAEGSGLGNEGDCTISNNIVIEGTVKNDRGIIVKDYYSRVLITNNIVKGFSSAIRTSSEGFGSIQNIVVSNNTVENFRSFGIITFPSYKNEPSKISILNNKILSLVHLSEAGILSTNGVSILNNQISGLLMKGIFYRDSSYIAGNDVELSYSNGIPLFSDGIGSIVVQ